MSKDKHRKQTARKNVEYKSAEISSREIGKFGANLTECIKKFHESIACGLYVCSSCRQTWFRESVMKVNNLKPNKHDDVLVDCLTGFKDDNGLEWICKSCRDSILKGKIPKLSMKNKLMFPVKPPELELHQLEERLIALRIPFMQIRELPVGGQKMVRGNVVNVPIDINKTVNSLPRNLSDIETVPVKLKRRLQYKRVEFVENIRPNKILKAVVWLKNNSPLYQNADIQINQQWLQNQNNQDNGQMMAYVQPASTQDNDNVDIINTDTTNNLDNPIASTSSANNDTTISNTDIPAENNHDDANDDDDDDRFSEIDDTERTTANMDTLLDDPEPKTYTYAPGEGQRPIGLYKDPDAEYLAFPTIYCGQRRQENKNLHYSDICKYELRCVDRRASSNIPNIFFKLKKLQVKQISEKVSLAFRRCKTKGKKYTAEQLLQEGTRNNMVKLDEGYYIFRTIRNSPPYLDMRKKDLFAMIRQLGLPVFFMSLSAADTRWPALLQILGKLIDGTDYTEEQVQNFDWATRSRLVSADPVTCARYFDHRFKQFLNMILKGPHNPLQKMTDSFYRVEFQQRGSPHIHMMAWIDDAPRYASSSAEEIITYIDQMISVSADVPEEYKQYLALQKHKHSKSCRKGGTKPICRFGFPIPPMSKTMILEPLDPDTDTDLHSKNFKNVQKVLKEIDGEEMSFEEFLTKLDMDEESYILSIQSSLKSSKVFLKREVAEIRINSYMKNMLGVWQANHDIQYILDAFAVAVYVVDYTCKSQKGMSAILDAAAKEAKKDNMEIRQAVRHIGNKFLNCVEVGAQEAAYLVLQMPITKSSREVVFINTNTPEERPFILKDIEKLENLPKNSTDIHQDGLIRRYARRPKCLEHHCLADYAATINIIYPKDKQIDDPYADNNDDDPTSDSENSNTPEETSEQHTQKLLSVTLSNGVKITTRQNPRVIRFVNFNKNSDSENYYRERLLLYLPWRNEDVDLIGSYETYEQHFLQRKNEIRIMQRKYESHNEEIQTAIQEAQEHDNTDDDEEEQTEQFCPTESSESMFFDPPRPELHARYDIASDLNIPLTQSDQEIELIADRLPEHDYRQLIQSLNKKQREFFTHVIQWIKTKQEPLRLFLTGGAGVGKSLVIKALSQYLLRHLYSTEGQNPEDCRMILTAPTAMAAYLINGIHIHVLFKLEPNKEMAHRPLSSSKLNTLRMKYRQLQIVIIDEISMVGCRMFNCINHRLQEFKGNTLPFGGLHVIVIGDLYQLKPCQDLHIFLNLPTDYGALATNLWTEHFITYELDQIMRQQDDLPFANVLNNIRRAQHTQADITYLQQRLIDPLSEDYPKFVPHFFPLNEMVDNYNTKIYDEATTIKTIVYAHYDVLGNCPREIKNKILDTVKNAKVYRFKEGLYRELHFAESLIYAVTKTSIQLRVLSMVQHVY